MEKRLLLAFVLSFLVLSIWSVSTRKELATHQDRSQPVKTSQQETPFVDEKKEGALENIKPEIAKSPETSTESSAYTEVENENLTLVFNSDGGTLHSAKIKKLNITLPLQKVISLDSTENKNFRLDRLDKNSVYFVFSDKGLRIEKAYNLEASDYIVHSNIKIKNVTQQSIEFDPTVTLFSIDFKDEISNKEKWAKEHARDQSLYEYTVYSAAGIKRKNNAYKFSSSEAKSAEEKIDWMGFRTRYACAIVKPDYSTGKYEITKKDENILNLSVSDKLLILKPNEEITLNHVIYFGPENSTILKKYGYEFEKIKRFYKLSLFDVVAQFIYRLLHFIYKGIPNWGVCILLISLIIYMSMYPLTIKGMSSMKKMQAMQPKIGALREKHKDNPQKLNKEMMDLYKENKINPLGGCFPLVLQMPVFIGLYQVLWRDSSFKGAGFLWIQDLSAPDRLISNIGGTKFDLNLLPILMFFIMFFQQRITLKTTAFADPDQKAQQQMMANIMPIMLAVLFYNFASGLNLYFTIFYTLSLFTQLKMSKVKV